LDGMADSEDDESLLTFPVDTNPGVDDCDKGDSDQMTRSSDDTCRTRRKRRDSDQPTRHPGNRTGGTATYKPVAFVPRPWRTPEGTVNHDSLKTMLRSVLSSVMENPGITRVTLIEKYAAVLQPVPLFELLEMLDEIGCIRQKLIAASHKPSLFSARPTFTDVKVDTGRETEVFFPTIDCILKLGQFFIQPNT
jgi:hypothetical protein